MAAEGLTAPSGAVALHTVRCAGSAVSGATGAARPERSLQAWFFRHRTVAEVSPPPEIRTTETT
ncbi:hypothetical protein CFB03_01425 [Salmonella enterica subsp. enterica serovar Typhimurium]|nr:hypothetical protein CFB03_01425 [Salmonella enterica subsp. enterica serovar Typhimurium]